MPGEREVFWLGAPPSPPSRLAASGVVAMGFSPYSGGTAPALHRTSLDRSPSVRTSLPYLTAEVEPVAPMVVGDPVPTLVGVTLARLNPWIPVCLWAGVIFAFSSIPSLGTGLGTWDLVLRKLAHAAEFAVLAVLTYRATRSFPVSLALASAYAATDEVHQIFVEGRVGSPADWAVDTAGAAVGLGLVAVRERRR